MEQSPWETTSAKERKQSSAFKRLHCLTTLRTTLSLSKMNAPRRPQNFNSLKRLEHDSLRFFVQHACSYNVSLTLPIHGVWISTVEFGEIRRPYKLISKIAGHDEAEQVSNRPCGPTVRLRQRYAGVSRGRITRGRAGRRGKHLFRKHTYALAQHVRG